jgi:hypothetical protein
MELAPTTAALYKTIVDAYIVPKIGGVRVDSLSAADLTTMYRELLAGDAAVARWPPRPWGMCTRRSARRWPTRSRRSTTPDPEPGDRREVSQGPADEGAGSLERRAGACLLRLRIGRPASRAVDARAHERDAAWGTPRAPLVGPRSRRREATGASDQSRLREAPRDQGAQDHAEPPGDSPIPHRRTLGEPEVAHRRGATGSRHEAEARETCGRADLRGPRPGVRRRDRRPARPPTVSAAFGRLVREAAAQCSSSFKSFSSLERRRSCPGCSRSRWSPPG